MNNNEEREEEFSEDFSKDEYNPKRQKALEKNARARHLGTAIEVDRIVDEQMQDKYLKIEVLNGDTESTKEN